MIAIAVILLPVLIEKGGKNKEARYFLTCFTVVSSISSFTITAITSLKIGTGSSVLAWIVVTLIYICKKTTLVQKLPCLATNAINSVLCKNTRGEVHLCKVDGRIYKHFSTLSTKLFSLFGCKIKN